jgi:hypothetical protein
VNFGKDGLTPPMYWLNCVLDQTDSVSVDLHQQRLNRTDACCPSAIIATASAAEKSKAAIQGS